MPRYNLQTQDLSSLANYSQELKRISGSLDAYIQALQVDQFAAIEVPNNTIGMRGLEYCSKFVESVRQCHISARQDKLARRAAMELG